MWWSFGFGRGTLLRNRCLWRLIALFLSPSSSDLGPSVADLFWSRIGGVSGFSSVFNGASGIGGDSGIVDFGLPRPLHQISCSLKADFGEMANLLITPVA